MKHTIDWNDEEPGVEMIDQTKLPREYTRYLATTTDAVVESIKRMRVRGAPAIGIVGAYGVVLSAATHRSKPFDAFLDAVEEDATRIAGARPTAVNLSKNVDDVLSAIRRADDVDDAVERALDEADGLAARDVEINKRIGDNGAARLESGDTMLTHCNTGALATVDWGTALGVAYSANERDMDVDVIATETRPQNQGSRLTTVELLERDVETTLIPDTATGHCLATGGVDAVIVGADRLVFSGGGPTGDQAVVFNKIGTYNLAVLADRHEVPFYVALPTSTIDAERTAADVEIEERDAAELREIYGTQNAHEAVDVYNPAFDRTPAELIEGVITEHGVFEPPLTPATLLPDS